MQGENPEERTGAPDEFHSAPVSHRIFVAIAGPAMNVAFGIIVFSLIYLFSGEYVRKSLETTQIGHVVDGSPAALARLQPGDKLIAINGKRLKDWSDLQMVVAINPDEELGIEIIRNGQKQTYNVKTETKEVKARRIGQLGVSPKQEVLISHIEEDSWAEKSGIEVGDLIDKVNGETIYTFLDFHEIARQNHGNEVQLEVRRGFMFDFDVISQEELNRGLIPRQLRRKFNEHDVKLSGAATISALEDDRGWKISDLEKVYKLQEGEGKINVFKDNGGYFVTDLQIDRKLIVGAIQKDSYIQDKGIRRGDQLISIAGVPVQHVDFDQKGQELTKIHGDLPVEFEFHRDVSLRTESKDNQTDSDTLDDQSVHRPDSETFTVMLNLMHPQDGERLLINEIRMDPSISGLALKEAVWAKKYNFANAWGRGVKQSWSMVTQAMSMVSQLFMGEVSLNLLSGPVGIVSVTAETARIGFRQFAYFAGFISVNLAFVNLLPIPITDGGQILFFIIEKLRGKPLSIRKQQIIHQVSFVLIIGLFLYITWFDLVGIFK